MAPGVIRPQFNHRFGRDRRLTGKADYQPVFKRARRYGEDAFTILVRDNGKQTARLGLAIARKTIKKAVARNRIKRIIRESFRTHADRIGGRDIVVMARRGADRKQNAELHAELARCWARLTEQ